MPEEVAACLNFMDSLTRLWKVIVKDYREIHCLLQSNISKTVSTIQYNILSKKKKKKKVSIKIKGMHFSKSVNLPFL